MSKKSKAKENKTDTVFVHAPQARPLTKGDLWILFSVILVAAGFFFWQMDDLQRAAMHPDQSLMLEMQSPGKGLETFLVSALATEQSREWELDGLIGKLVVGYEPKKGFSVSEASCPDQLCVRMGTINRAGQSIVCVPNEIVVHLLSAAQEGEGAVDVLLR